MSLKLNSLTGPKPSPGPLLHGKSVLLLHIHPTLLSTLQWLPTVCHIVGKGELPLFFACWWGVACHWGPRHHRWSTQDSAAALPISGDDGQVDSGPPIVKDRATSAANASPRLHLASVDDECVSPLPPPTIELAETRPASQNRAASPKHHSDILEEAELDPKSDTPKKLSTIVPDNSWSLKAGATVQRMPPANSSKNNTKTLIEVILNCIRYGVEKSQQHMSWVLR